MIFVMYKMPYFQYLPFTVFLCYSILDAARSPPAVSLKIVFLPLLAFEVIILVDNARY